MASDAIRNRNGLPKRLFPKPFCLTLLNLFGDGNLRISTEKISEFSKKRVAKGTLERMSNHPEISRRTENFLILTEVFNQLIERYPTFRKKIEDGGQKVSVITLWDLASTERADESHGFGTDCQPFSFEAPVADYIDRRELRELRGALNSNAPYRVGIFGSTGSGKTEMARILAELDKEKFDAIFEINLPGASENSQANNNCLPQAEPDNATVDALKRVISAFGSMPDEAGKDLDTLRREMLRVLRGSKALLMLDNISDEKQAAMLMPPLTCSVIVTSQKKLTLEGFKSVEIGAMCDSDAEEMVRRILRDRQGAEFSCESIAKQCGFNPFAIRQVATAIAKRVSISVEDPYFDYEDGPFKVMAPVNDLFELQFDDLSPEMQRLWTALAIFCPHFSIEDACELLGFLKWETDIRAGIEFLWTTSRIVPFTPLIRRRNKLPLPDQLDPGAEGRFMIERLQHDYLLQKLERSEYYAALQMRHSFFFREKLIVLHESGRARFADKERINQTIEMDFVSYHTAMRWAARNELNPESRAAFKQYLKERQTLERVNEKYRDQPRTMKQLLAKDAENVQKFKSQWECSMVR